MAASTPFQPETVDAYEIGAKLALFDRRLELNLAGYISDYKDMQQNLTVPGGPLGNQTISKSWPLAVDLRLHLGRRAERIPHGVDLVQHHQTRFHALW